MEKDSDFTRVESSSIELEDSPRNSSAGFDSDTLPTFAFSFARLSN
jgi:hypothetical protein